jgi:hypothetical protein
MSMKDAGHFRAQEMRCRVLLCSAKRADVQQALRCLAQEYQAAARAIEQAHGRASAATVARLPLTWPMLAMQRYMAVLVRTSLAFWLVLG